MKSKVSFLATLGGTKFTEPFELSTNLRAIIGLEDPYVLYDIKTYHKMK